MSELGLIDRHERGISSGIDVTGWVLRLSAGVLFLTVGSEKFQAESYWVELFAEIGLGVWFRYLTGALQMTGGLLLLFPGTARVGAVLAGCTMAGAVAVHLFVLNTGLGAAIVPAALLAFVTAAGFRRPTDHDR
jgi:putative oxidoreductase